MVNFDKTPWNAGPGELPGDPENDPGEYGQCEQCRCFFPNSELWFWVELGQWLCEHCRWEEEYGEPNQD